MAKKIYEGLEGLKQDYISLMEDIHESAKAINEGFAKLKPYLYYFSMIYTNYIKSCPDYISDLKKLDIHLRKNKDEPLTIEQRLLFNVMHIKAYDDNMNKLAIITDKLKGRVLALSEKIDFNKVSYKELNTVYTELETIYTMLEEGDENIITQSENYVIIMTEFQANYPYEYSMYTRLEIETKI